MRLAEAEKAAHQALSLAPNQAAAHHVLGGIQLSQGKQDEAMDSLRQALRLNPTSMPYKKTLARAVAARSPVIGWIWRGLLERRHLFFWRSIWFISFLLALGCFAVVNQFKPESANLAFIAVGVCTWLFLLSIRLTDRALTAAVMRGWIK
jgi:tetratricopeptide (TPR) repeat protein